MRPARAANPNKIQTIIDIGHPRSNNDGPDRPRRPQPAALQIAAAPDEPDDEQQQDRADRGVEDRRDNSDAKMDTEARQQPAPDKGTDNSDDDVTEDAKPGAAHDLAGQPARDQADKQDYQEAFT